MFALPLRLGISLYESTLLDRSRRPFRCTLMVPILWLMWKSRLGIVGGLGWFKCCPLHKSWSFYNTLWSSALGSMTNLVDPFLISAIGRPMKIEVIVDPSSIPPAASLVQRVTPAKNSNGATPMEGVQRFANPYESCTRC